MWLVLKNTKTNEYASAAYGWTMKLSEARRFLDKSVPKSDDHIRFVSYDGEKK